jgi:hypothetical protein
MELSFDNIINRHKGQTAYVLGLGPSLEKHFEHLKKTSNDEVIISCNRWNQMFDLNVKYWLTANAIPEQVISNNYIAYNEKNAVLVYSDTCDLTDKKTVEELLTVDYLPYDQRHHDNKECKVCRMREINRTCLKHLIPGRLTIQEELKKYCNAGKRYRNGGTVALHMLALAIMLGCNPIYILGVDLEYQKTRPYVKEGIKPWTDDGYMPMIRNDILEDFETIKNGTNVDIFVCEKSHMSKVFPIRKLK